MAGRIRASDVEEVKRRTNLGDLVGDYVSLKSAGIDSMKGLCPFHDERSPSFHVRPVLGYYHCFGCGESGDAFTFLQRLDHLSFAESVERLAGRVNYVLSYEEGGQRREDGPNRARLLEANRAAAAFFTSQLASDEGRIARSFLESRGFDADAAAHFGVGYAPKSWGGLTEHLRSLGFSATELLQAGVVSEGNRGVYDRFRGRAIWPIRDTGGQTIGFGARRLFEDDQGPKYLNTPESPVYRKSQVLYGLDLAKRSMSRSRSAVVVEGYTDVMACHLAGVETAVATCGTAFSRDHISVLRRVMGDDAAAEVVFTFDPDEAGQQAALRAFSEEQRFSAQTYVALAPEGLDPCELRVRHGDAAVQDLFARRTPLFAFALRQAIARFDVNSVEGRVSALRAAAPIVAGIKDPALRPGYSRELARMLGIELAEVQGAVRAAASTTKAGPGAPPARAVPGGPRHASGAAPDAEAAPPRTRFGLANLPATPAARLERDALMAMLQHADELGDALVSQAVTAEVREPALRAIRDALALAHAEPSPDSLLSRVLAKTPEALHSLVGELAVAPLPERRAQQIGAYARGVVIGLLERDLLALKGELVARMQRIGDPADPGSRRIQEQLMALETARRGLRHDAETGGTPHG